MASIITQQLNPPLVTQWVMYFVSLVIGSILTYFDAFFRMSDKPQARLLLSGGMSSRGSTGNVLPFNVLSWAVSTIPMKQQLQVQLRWLDFERVKPGQNQK